MKGNIDNFKQIIAKELGLGEREVGNTLALLNDGCTIPFISRYRKERTGSMDEMQIAAIADMNGKLTEMAKRKETMTKTIAEQGKLTQELGKRINECWNSAELEDIYLPFKPKRRTRAQVARENGLEPLAQIIMTQHKADIERIAMGFVKGDVKDIASALKGAQDIIAENVSEDERTRSIVRGLFRRDAIITAKVVKAEANSEKAAKYADYFDFSEQLRCCPAHRLLAIRRGEADGILRISIKADSEECDKRIKRMFVNGSSTCSKLVEEAVYDSLKRLVKPSIETEFASESKSKADDEAIRVFAMNLRLLLLAAPLGQKRVMGIDPGFRTGCKVVCLDTQGNLLPIAIGNGTAGRETEAFIKSLHLGDGLHIYMVSEDGASVYSASKAAREEFPTEDVTVRGAVSIGRRLMDPLAELVKIDPKSIGVGQYQHDVDQAKLKRSLDQTVVSCVNSVGVNLNTASQHLLTYVSGLGPALAQNIVDYRRDHGPFLSRSLPTSIKLLDLSTVML